MDNPFESGHIKNYILFYSSIVVIMVLFFIATTLFHDVSEVDKKKFDTNTTKKIIVNKIKSVEKMDEADNFNIKLMPKAY